MDLVRNEGFNCYKSEGSTAENSGMCSHRRLLSRIWLRSTLRAEHLPGRTHGGRKEYLATQAYMVVQITSGTDTSATVLGAAYQFIT